MPRSFCRVLRAKTLNRRPLSPLIASAGRLLGRTSLISSYTWGRSVPRGRRRVLLHFSESSGRVNRVTCFSGEERWIGGCSASGPQLEFICMLPEFPESGGLYTFEVGRSNIPRFRRVLIRIEKLEGQGWRTDGRGEHQCAQGGVASAKREPPKRGMWK